MVEAYVLGLVKALEILEATGRFGLDKASDGIKQEIKKYATSSEEALQKEHSQATLS